MNNLIKRIKRNGFGFRKFTHYRIRVLLYAGKPNWDLLATIKPAEIRRAGMTPAMQSGATDVRAPRLLKRRSARLIGKPQRSCIRRSDIRRRPLRTTR